MLYIVWKCCFSIEILRKNLRFATVKSGRARDFSFYKSYWINKYLMPHCNKTFSTTSCSFFKSVAPFTPYKMEHIVSLESRTIYSAAYSCINVLYLYVSSILISLSFSIYVFASDVLGFYHLLLVHYSKSKVLFAGQREFSQCMTVWQTLLQFLFIQLIDIFFLFAFVLLLLLLLCSQGPGGLF